MQAAQKVAQVITRTLFFVGLLTVGLAAPVAAQQGAGDRPELDPSAFLPSAEELPAGFSRQPQYDRTLVEDGVIRLVRFYTRDAPELPTAEHASILVMVALSDSPTTAASEFRTAEDGWESTGYALSTLPEPIGEEAVGGRSAGFFVGTAHPKEGALVQFRSGLVMATVQWVDNPGAAAMDQALDIARRIEARI